MEGVRAKDERGAKRHAPVQDGGTARMEEKSLLRPAETTSTPARCRRARPALLVWARNAWAPGWKALGELLDKHAADVILCQEVDQAIAGNQTDAFPHEWHRAAGRHLDVRL